MRGLAQRQVEPDLVGRALETLAERRDVRRDEGGDAVRSQRDTDVGRADHLTRQAGQPLTHLGAEHQPADLVHDPGRTAGPGADHRQLVGRDRRPHRGDDALGDRVAQRAPHRQRALEPLQPGPRLDRLHAGGQVGDLVEPEVREAESRRRCRCGRPARCPGWRRPGPTPQVACASSQLTGPPDPASSFCSSANIGRPNRSPGPPGPLVPSGSPLPNPNGSWLLMWSTVVATNHSASRFRPSSSWVGVAPTANGGTQLASTHDLGALAGRADHGHRAGRAVVMVARTPRARPTSGQRDVFDASPSGLLERARHSGAWPGAGAESGPEPALG